MKRIRQNNDIDITISLKDAETGNYIDTASCSDISVKLQTAGKKVVITDFTTTDKGQINFRFHAESQTRIGIYSIIISAMTNDGRVFTTDICDAFALVACSCEIGDEGEVNIETLDVAAEFTITALDKPGCECEPAEKKEPYALNIEELIVKGGGITGNAEVAQKVREALLSGAGVYVHYVFENKDILFDSIDYTRTWEAPFERTDLYASKHISIDYARSTFYLKLQLRVGGDFISITPSIDRIYIDKDTVRTAELINIYNMIKPDLKGVFRLNGIDYDIEFANYSFANNKVSLYLCISRFDVTDFKKYRVVISESAIAVTEISTKENPVKKEELYFNDGSDKVVPFRHPDLSTQPSILPYKFAGNYVYEQMFYINEPVNTDSHFVTIPLTMDELSAGELPVILDCNISAELNWNQGTVKWTKHVTNCNTRISFSEDGGYILDLEFLKEAEEWESGSIIFVNAWVRLVWTKKPDLSGGDDYYYQQQQGGGAGSEGAGLYFTNQSSLSDTTVTMAFTHPHTFYLDLNMAMQVPNDGLKRFMNEDGHVIQVYRSGEYGSGTHWNVTCQETSETFQTKDILLMSGATQVGITRKYLQEAAPKAYARLLNSQAVHLILTDLT